MVVLIGYIKRNIFIEKIPFSKTSIFTFFLSDGQLHIHGQPPVHHLKQNWPISFVFDIRPDIQERISAASRQPPIHRHHTPNSKTVKRYGQNWRERTGSLRTRGLRLAGAGPPSARPLPGHPPSAGPSPINAANNNNKTSKSRSRTNGHAQNPHDDGQKRPRVGGGGGRSAGPAPVSACPPSRPRTVTGGSRPRAQPQPPPHLGRTLPRNARWVWMGFWMGFFECVGGNYPLVCCVCVVWGYVFGWVI